MKLDKIDGINYVRRTIDTAAGPMQLEGMSVRALRKALASADDDALVFYMAEMVPELRDAQLLIGVIAGAGTDSPDVCPLFGPEGVKALQGVKSDG